MINTSSALYACPLLDDIERYMQAQREQEELRNASEKFFSLPISKEIEDNLETRCPDCMYEAVVKPALAKLRAMNIQGCPEGFSLQPS